MEGKGSISQYRGRLDNTLTSNDLTNEETLKTLVKNQILRSSEGEVEEYINNVVEKRTKEVANFLGMLRSVSINDEEIAKSSQAPHGGWKLKQDTQELRVMYREGPEGSPFHTLLVEGYVDGPLDVCLCISWESGLYQKWWPHITVPTFKVISSQCLQKIRIGEQISLVKMKVSWPLSTREALVHFFEFEYFEDNLIVVLLNSISDWENIDRSSHGFTKDGIPEAEDVVRIDVVGGFALQKVTADRSYFRTIANMDIKLDFIPPAFINFISRQLIGSGFKLYKKEVASVSRGDEDFRKALKDPLYTRVHEGLYSDDISEGGALEQKNLKSDVCVLPEEHVMKSMEAEGRIKEMKVLMDQEYLSSNINILPGEHQMKTVEAEGGNTDEKVLCDDHPSHSATEDTAFTFHNAVGEIEEIEESEHLEEDSKEPYDPQISQFAEKCYINQEKKVVISSEVEQALQTLDKVISIFREYGLNPETRYPPGFTDKKYLSIEKDEAKDSMPSGDVQICQNGGSFVELSKNASLKQSAHEARNSSGSHGSRRAREASQNKIAPAASPDEDSLKPSETPQIAFCSSENGTAETTVLEKTINAEKPLRVNVNGISGNGSTKRKNRKLRFCCSHFTARQLMN